MRILFTTYSEKTHFHAMVPLAWALAAAGHEVRVASQPALTDVVTRSGLTAVAVGSDHHLWRVLDRFLNPRFAQINPELYKQIRAVDLPPFDTAEDSLDNISWEYLQSGYDTVIRSWYRMINDPMTSDLVAFARYWKPDLVIWEQATYAGPVAAKAVGAAHIRMPWCLDIFGKTREHFRRLREKQPEGARRDPLGEWLTENAERYGAEFSEDMTTGQFTIDQYPAPLQLRADIPYLPMQYVPYNGVSVVPEWLRHPPEKPRVCFTLGVSATQRFGGYPIDAGELLDALADLDAEIVATVPEETQKGLPLMPDNIRLTPFVPLNALMPTCVASVNHGAFGTVNTTALAGVPQLTIPEQHDNPPFCNRLVEYGAGLTEYYTNVTSEKVHHHLTRLLTEPSFTSAAAALRTEMLAMPTPRDLVPRLVEIAETHRP
ncbi:glycosyl transferase [Streptomyces albus subsp. albus]|nr:glycosyl transferase [Streptomyces albus subsp. albus]